MGDVAIRVEGLSKQYQLGELRKYKALRDTLTDALHVPLRLLHSIFKSPNTEKERGNSTIWALKDVSFEIKPGEVVGIIGRNGAGKSTLLKILSRITEPTSGCAEIHGRVGSLLEVGTGFHPELTGRENIYLNGSIMGMRKKEIEHKFHEIVAFAEVEQFIDTQVKFYSTGMYLRLAFAVAAHLEPEILLVDEVLAVGDAVFQKKCLGKMGQVSKEGRTVVLVSHSLSAVRSLCHRACLFENGQLVMVGTSDECIERYVNRNFMMNTTFSENFPKPSSASPWMSSAVLICNGEPSGILPMGADLAIAVEFQSETPLRQPRFGFIISTEEGDAVLCANNRFQISPEYMPPAYKGSIHCHLGIVPLMAGRYVISLFLGDQVHDSHVAEHALSFEVIERDIWGQGHVPPPRVSYLWWPTTFLFH